VYSIGTNFTDHGGTAHGVGADPDLVWPSPGYPPLSAGREWDNGTYGTYGRKAMGQGSEAPCQVTIGYQTRSSPIGPMSPIPIPIPIPRSAYAACSPSRAMRWARRRA